MSKPVENDVTSFSVQLGTYSSLEEIIRELKHRKLLFIPRAWEKLDIPMSSPKQTLNLKMIAVSELGFTQPVRFRDFYDRAQVMGLDLVPADTALYLALQASDHVETGVVIAMEEITDSSGCYVFGLYRIPWCPKEADLWLDVIPQFEDYWLDPELELVFSI